MLIHPWIYRTRCIQAGDVSHSNSGDAEHTIHRRALLLAPVALSAPRTFFLRDDKRRIISNHPDNPNERDVTTLEETTRRAEILRKSTLPGSMADFRESSQPSHGGRKDTVVAHTPGLDQIARNK